LKFERKKKSAHVFIRSGKGGRIKKCPICNKKIIISEENIREKFVKCPYCKNKIKVMYSTR